MSLAQKAISRDYKPSFSWKDDTICDREEPIARLESYGRKIDKPLRFFDLKLSPQGETPLSCWMICKRINCLKDLGVKLSRKKDKLVLDLEQSSVDDRYRSITSLALSYDSSRACYCYLVQSKIYIAEFPYFSWRDLDTKVKREEIPLEFANIFPRDACNYRYPLDKKGKKWQAFIYQDTDGDWVRVPQHHLITPDKFNIGFSDKSGQMGFFDEPVGNPGIVLLNGTARKTTGELCWAKHDIHLRLNYVGLAKYYEADYMLLKYTPAESKKIVQRAATRKHIKAEKEQYDLPRFNWGEICDFENGFDFEKADINCHFWQPTGSIIYTKWEKGEGVRGTRCLKTDSPVSSYVAWLLESTNGLPVEQGAKYQVDVWVKTNRLTGEGAYLEAWYHNTRTISRSKKITGDSGWTKVSVCLPAVTGKWGVLNIRLVHEGKGISWFDNVEVRTI